MLNNLSVKNYALIDSVEIDFDAGLSIITGETGAGKSILLGALSLILGQRADISVLKNKEKKCIIEGSFSIAGYSLEPFFQENEIDYENDTVLRREINPAGKSRAFINDTPVNLNTLRELSLRLVDIHSQHQNLNLNESVFQLNIIDTFAGNGEVLTAYSEKYNEYSKLKKQLNELKASAGRSKEDFEYFKFQFEELENVKLVEGEQDALEDEQKALTHSEDIQLNLSNIFNRLSENEGSVLENLNESVKSANQALKFLPKIEDIAKRLESSYIELKDITTEVETIAEKVHFDPERANFVNERLNLIYSLQQKHRVSTIEELIEIKNNLFGKINDIESFDERLEEIQQKHEKCLQQLEKVANKLSVKRKSAKKEIEKYVEAKLQLLGMPGAVFQIDFEENKEYTISGKDKVSFLFSGNKNGNVQNIAKVASGGEISRLMLSIKSLMSKSSGLPTIIFDEIDTGVSGEIADKMGGIILDMSENMQVLNITHLPQVAAKGNTHYLVHKQQTKNSTVTGIKRLNEEERLKEIAKMLSGENLSPQALENAKVLLESQK